MSLAQSEKKGTKRLPNEEEAIAHSKNRKKLEKEESKTTTTGVYLTPTEKYKSICQGIYIGTFDTEEAAANAFNLALGKTKEQLKQEMALKKAAASALLEQKRLQQRVTSEAAKSLERERKKKIAAATGYVGVAERRMKITNITCDQRLASSQIVGPEGQTKVAKVITKIMSDDFVVPP